MLRLWSVVTLACVLVACGSSPSPTSPAASVNVTGLWVGNGLSVPFQQNGTALTASYSDAQGLHTFNLTQTAQTATSVTFTGTLRYDGTGACNPSTMSGTIGVDLSSNTMTLSFSGKNADCNQETVSATLHKQ